jgi:hypothetical protein
MSDFSCLLPFDSDAPEFARGFEVGRLWGKLQERPEDPFEEYVHAQNVEMVLRIADATSRSVRSDELGDDWLIVQFSASGAPLDTEAESLEE